ncbi:hypothetical protein EDD80_10159 [Anseongella ginsenosidimutans]|uniref:Cupin n=1 Tax=Anseongella ginsenosidimutans TaxID=496056 RepID=A0A4R3L094_9SPHI|nr:cupin domain-containing protein [Anseongella ginsenosidimutans]QEC51432.1 cupin [Anseongella ginsenosidimutans]TCS89862.1 hypothetical protein EDD80_10159 [Anseongella ginsenosidimutans]
MEENETEKAKAFIMVEIIEYMPHAVISKTLFKKPTGSISITAIDSGESLVQKTSPFDIFIQIIEGKAEILIDNQSHLLETGQSIILPAHIPNAVKANVRFKMISTIIKSGYE